MDHIVLTDGRSVSSYMLEQIVDSYHRSPMPPLLPGAIAVSIYRTTNRIVRALKKARRTWT